MDDINAIQSMLALGDRSGHTQRRYGALMTGMICISCLRVRTRHVGCESCSAPIAQR